MSKPPFIFQTAELPIARLQPMVMKVLGVLQSLSPQPQNLRLIDDWLDHDGLEFVSGVKPLASLFSMVATPRALFENTPKDHAVFLRVEAEDGDWTLRIRTDWDDDDHEPVGEFSLSVTAEILPRVQAALQLELLDGSFYREEEEL